MYQGSGALLTQVGQLAVASAVAIGVDSVLAPAPPAARLPPIDALPSAGAGTSLLGSGTSPSTIMVVLVVGLAAYTLLMAFRAVLKMIPKEEA